MELVSDEQLIRWIAAGDKSCLGTLFERHHVALYNFCLQISHNTALAEDTVQETFVKMLKASASFRGDGSFRGWMFNIARNLMYDHMRREKRMQPLDEKQQDQQAGAEPGPEKSTADRQGGEVLERALALLPEAAREVIWLGRFQFDGYAELGQALDCSAGTARVRMHRAVKQLREIFLSLNEESANA
jgi:RNA polymerase sigma-70 factor (ECF subfamily)